MAKRHTNKKPQFRLTAAANKMLNQYFAEIRKGIENVSEMHKHDSNPSMTQAQFEAAYIERLLATPIAAISATVRGMVEGLTAQKEAEAAKLIQANKSPEKGTEE
ncbi:MAG: hypothetical protein NC184_05640 [Roseburia sp.]|nr:hypothetical protein [Roseburia sp.]